MLASAGETTPLICLFFCLFLGHDILYHLMDLISCVFGFDHQFDNILHIYFFIYGDFGSNPMFLPSVALELCMFRRIYIFTVPTFVMGFSYFSGISLETSMT